MLKKNISKSFNWKKYLLLILFFLFFIPLIRVLYKQYIKLKNDTEDGKITLQEAERLRLQKLYQTNPVTAQNARDKITVRKDVQQASQDLAHNLGTKYMKKFEFLSPSTWFVFNPRAWTENDKKVADILLAQRLNYSYLKRLYNEIDTENRSLTNDIYEYLDENELKRVSLKLKIT